MRKKYLSALLFGVALTAATGTFVSCKDYDDDIDNLQEQIDAQKSDLSTQLSTLDNALKEANSSAAAANTAAGNAATAAAAAQSEAEKAQQLAKQADENAKAAAAEAKAEAIKEVMAEVQELIKATDGNVSDLKQKFDELSTKISAIDQKYDTLKGTVDANEKAIAELKLQIEALKRYEQKISDNATNIGQNATDIDEVEKAVKKIQDDMKSIATTSAVKDVEKKVDGVATTVARINANLVTIAGKELRSLTLIPPFYADGIESVEYPYVLDNYLTQYKGTISGNTSENTSYKVEEQIISFPVNLEDEFYFNPVAEVSYNMNPSSAKINSTDELTFTVKNAESYTRAEVIPAVNVTGFDTKKNPGDVIVSFTSEGKKISAAKNLINIMALEVEIKGTENKADTTITSDYAALYPSKITMEAIAFSQDEKAIDCVNPTKDEIWTTAKDAIEHEASLAVEYNGSLELKDYLNIHYNQSNKVLGLASDTKTAGEHKILAYGDEAKYNLEYKYTLVPYTIGTENYYGAQTKESAYGYVEATGHFEPRYVDSNGNSIKSDGTSGVSSIGKQPLVRVEVVDKTSGKTVLGGFIKIKIVRTIAPKEAAAMDLGKVSYTCNYADKYVTWAQMSSNLLELAAVSSKAEFEQLYSLETVSGSTYAGPDGTSNDWYAIVYTKDKDGKYNALGVNYKYGYIEEYGHVQGEANDRLRWALFGQSYRDNIFEDFGKANELTATATVYVCYKPKEALSEGTLPRIYVPLTLTVVKPAANYGTKIQEYWFADSKNTALGAQRLNVAYPKNNGNTEDYTVDLDNAFEGNVIKYTITNNQDKVFDNDWAKAGYVRYTYYFTEDNAGRKYEVDGVTYTLSLNANEKPYYRTLYANNQIIATINQNGYYYNNNVLTRFENDGNVQYAGTIAPSANDVAKKLLNAWTHDDAASGHNYFANVGIRAYNDCGITLGTWKFESRFLRPIDVNGVKDGQFVDAEANGSVINVADLFEFIDWRDVKFTGSNAWLFAYYDVKSVKVDIANITTNMNGHDINTKKLKDVTSQVIFTHVDANGTISTVNSVSTKNFDLSAYNTASATPANVLAAVKAALGQIKYENNGNNVKEFQVRIPIEIGYEWGSIKSYVDCKVVNTQGNNNPDQQ